VEKNSFILVDREANIQFMSSRGMSMEMLTDVILSLKPEDCFDGPEPDRDPRYAEKWTGGQLPNLHQSTKAKCSI